MLIGENAGSTGKNFQNSADIIIVVIAIAIAIAIAIDRDDCYRADFDCLRSFRVTTAVGCDVVTA